MFKLASYKILSNVENLANVPNLQVSYFISIERAMDSLGNWSA